MDPLATRTLGRTGVALTRLGFGGAPLGELFTRVSEEAATATLRAAWDAGLRYFDTAPWYGRGQSEQVVSGKALSQRHVHGHRAGEPDSPTAAAQSDGQREGGKQQDRRDQASNRARGHVPPYHSTASLRVVTRSGQRAAGGDFSQPRGDLHRRTSAFTRARFSSARKGRSRPASAARARSWCASSWAASSPAVPSDQTCGIMAGPRGLQPGAGRRRMIGNHERHGSCSSSVRGRCQRPARR